MGTMFSKFWKPIFLCLVVLGEFRYLIFPAVERLIVIEFFNDVVAFLFSDLDDTEGGLDQARVKEKEGVDSNPPTPGSSEGHRMSQHIRFSRSMTVTSEDEVIPTDEEDAKYVPKKKNRRTFQQSWQKLRYQKNPHGIALF